MSLTAKLERLKMVTSCLLGRFILPACAGTGRPVSDAPEVALLLLLSPGNLVALSLLLTSTVHCRYRKGNEIS